MQLSRTLSWFFVGVAAVLALYSLGIAGWMLWEAMRSLFVSTRYAGGGGAPNNLGAGIAFLIWLVSGVVAALFAYVIAAAASPFDQTSPAWRVALWVERSALVGGATPLLLWCGFALFT